MIKFSAKLFASLMAFTLALETTSVDATNSQSAISDSSDLIADDIKQSLQEECDSENGIFLENDTYLCLVYDKSVCSDTGCYDLFSSDCQSSEICEANKDGNFFTDIISETITETSEITNSVTDAITETVNSATQELNQAVGGVVGEVYSTIGEATDASIGTVQDILTFDIGFWRRSAQNDADVSEVSCDDFSGVRVEIDSDT